MTDIIEGEVREIPPERAVAVAERTQVIMGSASLALMSEPDFEANLAALQVQRKRGDQIKRALMAEGTDYGTVPGVPKAFLWKSGAETLDKAFGLVATFDVRRVAGTRDDEPPYSFHAHSLIHLGSADGPIVGEGFGTCNPWESRYRYRNGERLCPNCGKPAVIKGKEEYGGGWLCFRKKDGCGSKWPDGDQAIEGQSVGQLENENPWDLENTIAKMAEKRAHVDGTIRATGTSGLFTQDDDSPAVKGTAPSDTPAQRGTSSPASAAPLSAPAAVPPSGGGTLAAEVTGTVKKGDGNGMDMAVRETPQGPGYGFKLVDLENHPKGRKSAGVRVFGGLAAGVALALTEGIRVTVAGNLVAETIERKDQPDIHYDVLVASSVTTEAGPIPALELAGEKVDDIADLPW